MITDVKRTKRDKYVDLIDLLKTVEAPAEYVELCEKEIEAIDKKAEKAKERAAKKKDEADELYEKVMEALQADEKAATINEIVATIDEAEVTSAKVVNRLKKMVDAGLVEKSTMVEDKRRINAYKWIG